MTKITSKTVRGRSTDELNSKDNTKYIWTESGLGANTFIVDKDTVSSALNLTGLTGDVINIDGYSGDYTARLTNSILTLQTNDQTITVSLAKNSIITLQFTDSSKEVNLKNKTLNLVDIDGKTLYSQSLATKSGVLHIDGISSHEALALAAIASHEAQALAAAAKLAAQDKVTALAAAAQDKANALAAAAQDKANALALAAAHETSALTAAAQDKANALALAAAHETLVVKAASANALTVTSGITAGKSYLSVNAAIDDAIKAVTSYPTMAEFTDAYNKLLLPTFSVTGNSVVTEGSNATFVVNLSNQGSTGDYTVYADLKSTGGATPGADFASTLTLVDADHALEKLHVTLDANGKLTIPAAAHISNVTLSSLVATDLTTENGEGLNLTLSTPSNALLGINKSVSTTINDVQLLPTFNVEGSSVTEGKDAIFLVNLANRGTSDYSVITKLSPIGTANTISNEDFESTLKLDQNYSGVSFDPLTGVLAISKSATVSIIKLLSSVQTDLITPENGEGLHLELSAPTNAELGTKTSDIMITDVAPPTFSVKPQTPDIDEGGKPAVFVISLDNKGAGEYKVNLKLEGINVLTSLSNPINANTSVANNTVNPSTLALTPVALASLLDFDPTLTTQSLDALSILAGVTLTAAGILTIPANTNISSVKLSIPVKSDQVTPENGEGIKLTLSLPTPLPTNAVIGTDSTAKMTIIDKSSTALTTGLDSITGGNGDSIYTANGFTLNAIDNISDTVSTDNDEINITTDKDIPAATISGIETINLTALNAITVNMKPATGGFSGVNAFNIKDSTGVVTLTNIPNATMAIGLSGSGVNNVIATYSTNATPAASVTTTNNDTLRVNLESASNANISVNAPFYAGTDETTKIASFETAEIKVLGPGQSSITNYKLITTGTTTYLPTLTISGDGELRIGPDALKGVSDIQITDTGSITIGAVSTTKLRNLNASDAGAVTADNITGALTGLNALFSKKNDNVNITSAAISGSNTVKLGGGSDILNMTSVSTADNYLFGEDGNDIIIVTGAGTSYIDGGLGDDKITSGSGTNNTITGGYGADTFTSSGTDTITDFILTGTGADTLTINSSGSARVYPYLASTGGTLSFSAINNSGTLRIDGSTIYGGVPITGSEIITGSTGKDSITGGTGNDSLDGGAGNDTINGGAGNDTIIGGQGSDSLGGGAGDDTFMTSSILFTADTIDGNDGTDTLSFTDTDSSITFNTTTIIPPNVTGIEKITTTANPLAISIVVANSGVDPNPVGLTTIDLSGDTNALGTNVVSSTGANGLTTIIGSAGIDTITLGTSAPATTITGGLGADAFSINNGSNTVVTITDFLPGTDTLSIAALTTVQVYSSTAINGMNYAGVSNSGTLYIDGSAVTGAQAIIGGAGKDSIVGGSGTDEITSGAGADTINGGAGNDTFLFNTSDAASGETINDSNGTADTIKVLTSTDFSLLNTTGTTTLSAMGIEQILITSGQTATFTGAQLTGQGINVNAISAAAAALVVTATTNATTDLSALTFTAQANPAVGNAFDTGVDTVTINGAGGTNTINGTSLADTINGTGTGTDTIDGKAGNDTITGGAGSDVITGGAGADIIDGGSDNDTYVVSTVTSDTGLVAASSNSASSTVALDVITVTAGDKIDLTASLGTDANYVNVVTTAAAAYTAYTGLATTTVYEVKGAYIGGATKTFTPSDTGTDVLLYWASANGTTADQQIVLVGTGAVADTIVGGILTIG